MYDMYNNNIYYLNMYIYTPDTASDKPHGVYSYAGNVTF